VEERPACARVGTLICAMHSAGMASYVISQQTFRKEVELCSQKVFSQ
jgi:NO-binding membrane sensor protein with MHYT domain